MSTGKSNLKDGIRNYCTSWSSGNIVEEGEVRLACQRRWRT